MILSGVGEWAWTRGINDFPGGDAALTEGARAWTSA